MNIRLANKNDAAVLVAIYAPYVEKTAITFEYDVPSMEEFSGRIEKTLERYPYLVAEEEGVILGYAYASTYYGREAYNWAVELSVYVADENRGRGIGKLVLLCRMMPVFLSIKNVVISKQRISQKSDINLTAGMIQFGCRRV